ncbi:MAG: hypothetical protein HY369_00325 [Candidatus Aenigmarchaeota archaeon]|nr:hypothetical protein [Candidatus Aenigmarchaeota archaeon]
MSQTTYPTGDEAQDQTPYRPSELARQADQLLRAAGLDIFGRQRSEDGYLQARFEYGMPRNGFRGASRRA